MTTNENLMLRVLTSLNVSVSNADELYTKWNEITSTPRKNEAMELYRELEKQG